MDTDAHGAHGDEGVHRALASPSRRQLLRLLGDDEDGADIASLAERLGLHINTVRRHLAVLEDAGLVASATEERDRPGRPRLRYHVMPAGIGTVGVGDDRGYRFIAEVLASHLSGTAADPASVAEAAGATWGRHLIERPPPYQRVGVDVAVSRVIDLLDSLGFAPELDDKEADRPRVLLRRCPFLDIVKDHQDVICSIHLGLMRGALEELGSKVRVQDLLPFVEPSLCISHLERTG
jgi:predicted ArsR family transcriptional regulator